jgi:hypothetical protein
LLRRVKEETLDERKKREKIKSLEKNKLPSTLS